MKLPLLAVLPFLLLVWFFTDGDVKNYGYCNVCLAYVLRVQKQVSMCGKNFSAVKISSREI
jgi:hypothetical protein